MISKSQIWKVFWKYAVILYKNNYSYDPLTIRKSKIHVIF